MRRSVLLIASLLLVLCFSALPAQASENEVWWASAKAESDREGYRLIDCTSLNERLQAGQPMLLLDARADYEFEAGHIPGAVNMEFDLGDRMDLSADKREALKRMLGPDTARTVVIYCRSFR